MKVTVCFGSVRIVVPCGNGEIPVSELVEKSIPRYRKAIGKPPDYWVTIHNLKSYNDGGILDPDDQLNDVVDDREQILAIFEEQGGPPIHHHNGGDGTSASSVGTSSPDIFQNGDSNHVYLRHGSKNDVIITPNDLNTGSSLIVRRGSEPALNKVGVDQTPGSHSDFFPLKSNKRWSAIASIDEAKTNRDSEDEMEGYNDDTPPPTLQRVGGNGQEKDQEQNNVSFTTFARDSARRSLANNVALHKWLEAQERQQELHLSRKDPVGSTAEDDNKNENKTTNNLEFQSTPKGDVIAIRNEGGPLGIHVVPDYDESGRDMGLVIQGIEAGGRIYRDGRLHVLDRISEINGTSLIDVNFSKAQEIFKHALQTEEIRLRVIKSGAPPLPRKPPPIPPTKPVVKKQLSDRSTSSSQSAQSKPPVADSPTTSTPCKDDKRSTPTTINDSVMELPSEINITTTVNDNNNNEGKDPSTPTKKVPPAVPVRSPSTSLSAQTKSKIVAPTNTRRIGKKIHIQLTKGNAGLGFSITTRDNLTGGHCPIYIKNILPKGAAVDDGRLKPGDRLLEVNGIEMTGKTQSEAVSILRNTKLGSVVNLVVSRQVVDNLDESKNLPRELSAPDAVPLQPPEKAQDDEIPTSSKDREVMTFHIPLNASGAAGLGVSVKGKTSTSPNPNQDLGIFIKSVITGGAASKDGRLRINDQLIKINNESLIGKTNQEAMATLRNAMQKDGPIPGRIDITVSRRVSPSGASTPVPDSPGQEVRISQSEAHGENAQEKSSESEGKDTTDSVFLPPGIPPSLASKLAASYALRNVSYQRATHESMMNETTDSVLQAPAKVNNSNQNLNKGKLASTSSTLNTNRGETVLIEGESYQVHMRQNTESNVPKNRPASTLGFQEPQSPAKEKLVSSKSNEDLLDGGDAPKPPGWLDEYTPDADESELSPRDTEFHREGFGRQSMSEKRKGHIDPRTSEFFQKIKQNKDKHQIYSATWDPRRSAFRQVEGSGLKRVGSAESLLNVSNNRASLGLATHENWLRVSGEDEYQSEAELELLYHQKYKLSEPSPVSGSASFHFSATKPHEVGPSLGLKKSSSLESLQTAVQEVNQDEQEGGNVWRPPNRGMVRGRGCNESFRAAVDRSYEDQEPMETLDEEDSENGSTRSRASSVSGGDLDKKNKKVSKPKQDKDKDKDKGGIFKGWGHMFRFGKNRKPLDDRLPPKSTEELKKERKEKNKSQTNLAAEKARSEEEKDAERAKAIKEEQDRVREHYKKLQEKQRAHDAQRAHEEHARAAMPPPPPGPPPSRAEKIQNLRAEHQKRHRERQGHYPQEDREELYERQIQEYERQYPGTISLQQELLRERGYNPIYAIPPRRRIDDPYDSRPGSRMGHADPNRYSHYANFHEIQEQIKRHDYYQQRYHQYMAAQQEAARQHASSGRSTHPPTPAAANPYKSDPRQVPHDSRQVMHDPLSSIHDSRHGMHDSRQSSATSVHSAHAVPYASRNYLPDPRNPRDPRNWGHGYPSRSVTPGAERPRAPGSPGRARSQTPSQTPINQLGYGPHSRSGGALPSSSMPYNTPYETYGMHRGRSYSEFNDPRNIYQGSREPSYGSLPRTRRERGPTLVSNSAQV